MAGVLWAFVRTPYPSLPEFVTAVIANHVKIIGNHEGRFVPSALVIPAPQISVSYRAVRGDNPQAVVRSTTLVADDPTGFRQGELLWKLHQALVKENLADHPFFEGLTLSNRDDDPPSYLLLQGS